MIVGWRLGAVKLQGASASNPELRPMANLPAAYLLRGALGRVGSARYGKIGSYG